MDLANHTASPKKQLLTYTQLFRMPFQSKAKMIMMATARLGMVLRQPMEESLLEAWAQDLSPFTEEEMSQAFHEAEISMEAWPTPAKLINLIFSRRFDAEYLWLTEQLRIFHPAWSPLPEVVREAYDPETCGYTKTVKRMAAAPPPISYPTEDALRNFGHGNMRRGLELIFGEMRGEPSGDLVKRAFRVHWMDSARRSISSNI